ncbi:S1-C subfamily serine protease [Sphingomonas sp. PvP055]|uniref:S1C family serine protease n=1 Tax=Sphingomonas sp. PvP055 TaxID=3156391 RepID=UPI003397B040
MAFASFYCPTPFQPRAKVLLAALVLMLATLFAGAPARADDISATARSVVRVVTIAIVDDEVVGFGHGSGFAVAPNRIVTNAHVVELAARYPGNVVIGVVPSEGTKGFEGKVIAIDTVHDLALIEFTGARLPTVALYTGPVDEGSAVTALGYPGNVDLATARSAADYIHPLAPIRTGGVFSGRRQMEGTAVMLHTAGIARGNSGGPLLDPCGRVVGVNSAITQGEEGDANFGFAIANSELAAFLARAKQPYASVGTQCTSIADIDKADRDADAQALGLAEVTRRDAAARAALAQEAAFAAARMTADRHRENIMAIATLLLVLGAMGIGAGTLFEMQGKRSAAIWGWGGGSALMLGAIIVFVLRPTGETLLPKGTSAPSPTVSITPVSSTKALGKLVCRFVPDRSRVISSQTTDVPLDWGTAGCMNGRTQYAENGSKWDRILVPDQEQTVSLMQFDPATRQYVTRRYFLSAEQMDTIRKIRSQVTLKACSPDEAGRANLATQQAAIRTALPPQPNEKIVYTCTADSRSGG